MYQYIAKCKLTLKMIQTIITLHEVFSHIFNMSPIPYEKFHSSDFTKNIWMTFFI